jgi:exonuclease III
MDPASILVWNVHGPNGVARHDAVRALVTVECPSVVCIQETKLSIIYD